MEPEIARTTFPVEVSVACGVCKGEVRKEFPKATPWSEVMALLHNDDPRCEAHPVATDCNYWDA